MPSISIADPAVRAVYTAAAADGRLSIADVLKLKESVMDGKGISATEASDLAKIRGAHTLSATAAKIWQDSFTPLAPVKPLPEVRKGVYVSPLESVARWEGYVHTTQAPYWVFEQWTQRSVPSTSPAVTEVRQGDKRYLEFAGGPNSPTGRIDITNLRATTFGLASTTFGGESWSVKLEPQANGLPWKATLIKETPGGQTYPNANNRRYLGSTTTWQMFLS